MSADIRWSYDPRTNELDVWDSNDGRISHYDRHGMDGYKYCAQGRLKELHSVKKGKTKVLDGISATIYGDRPMTLGDSEVASEITRSQGQFALNQHYHPHPVHWQLTF